MDADTVELLTPMASLGESCGYEACPAARAGHITVHVAPHSHAELGYTRTFSAHYTGEDGEVTPSKVNMKRILDATIAELWANPDRTFTLSSSEFPYFFHWWSERHPTVHRMVYELLRQGRLVLVGGGWGMADEATTGYRALVDSYTYSLRKINSTFLHCGRPLVAWQADTFGHSREVASLLAQMGFDGLFFSPMSFDDEIIRMNRQALEFVWRGSDDLGTHTDILAHKLFDGYWSPPGFCFGALCSDPLLVHSDSIFNNIEERVDAFLESIRYRQAPHYPTPNVLVMMGQRFGYFRAATWFKNIDRLIDEVKRKASKEGIPVHVVYSSPPCYLKAVHSARPTLEPKQDDFLPLAYNENSYAVGFYTALPAFKLLIRQANVYLQMAKQLQVLGNLANNTHLLDNFMWLVGLMQDHGIITGGLRESVMNHYAEKLHHAVDQSVGLLEQILRRHGHPANVKYFRCPFNESSCSQVKDTSFYIVLYNPLAWNVTVPVRIPVEEREYNVFGFDDNELAAALLPIPSPVLTLTSDTHELVFIAQVPALGYISYYIHTDRGMKRSARQVNEDDEETTQTTTKDDELEIKPIEEIERRTQEINGTEDNKNMSNVDGATVAKEDQERNLVNQATPAEESKDDFIKNQYIQINLDKYRKISSIQLSNGLTTSLDLQYYYYVSDDPHSVRGYVDPDNPEPFKPDRKSPGTYIFRTMDRIPVPIIDTLHTKVFKTDVVQEIHTSYSKYASLVVRLYDGRPLVEVDWMVGTIPVEDGLGKEVFIRYTTDLKSDGVFYTDANGRQTVMRRRNLRGTYEPFNLDPIAGNIYPVTSRIYIDDTNNNMRFSIFNDRPQGGTSLHDGSVDVLLQRRILTDDAGFQAYLNVTNVVRGTHYLYLTKADYKPNRIFEKKLVKEIELHPLKFIAQNISKEKWMTMQTEYSALKTKLPVGVHVLTIQEWDENTLLLRLENYLEKSDALKSGTKHVNIKDLFVNIKINKIRETMLAGHIWLEDWQPLQWQLKNNFFKNFNEYYANSTVEYIKSEDLKPVEQVDLDKGITLTPQQIRTFVVWYEV
ncbi:lysosomal alpha-mannosidase-like [Aricia agestis]|uniref:lysosomal alpha-mannosidase-like n=1 Tax=Aricia agestis TaxID=91739 RepID=UPI001C2027F8|nr:lysosomal alpha-mannosidase-like [Aricia agestis]